MKQREVILYGQTDQAGNFKMANKQEMREFFQQRPGEFFTMKIEVHSTKKVSAPLQAYYYKKVVPDMQRAIREVEGLRLTQEQTDKRIREASPILKEETFNFETFKFEEEILEIHQLDNQKMVFFLEELKEFAAEQYQVFIEDPGNF